MPSKTLRTMMMLAAALALPACSRVEQAAKSVQSRLAGPIDKDRLEKLIDHSMGGPNSCVVLVDTKSGSEAYRYGDAACTRELPPCSTFDIPLALAALDFGGLTADSVVKWDGSPQPVRAWEHDADLRTAFKDGRQWFFQKIARDLGPVDLGKQLQDLNYGNKSTQGPADRFWMGPSQGGQLLISTRGQTAFLRRLYGGKLQSIGPRPVSPPAAQQVTAMMVDEIRSGSTISGKTGTCASNADGSRQVGWWIGRLQGPKGDYVFAASVEGQGSLPGLEVQTRLKSAFAGAGLWPEMPEG
jgi:beta-lactamase class D